MRGDKFKVGDKVRHPWEHGSTGEVVNVRDTPVGLYGADPAYTIRYVYGRDMKGNVVSEQSNYVYAKDLMRITDAEFIAVQDRQFGSAPRAEVLP